MSLFVKNSQSSIIIEVIGLPVVLLFLYLLYSISFSVRIHQKILFLLLPIILTLYLLVISGWEILSKKNFLKFKIIVAVIFFIVLFATILIHEIYYFQARLGQVAIHDSVVQTEEAIKFLLAGKNFYSQDFHGTALDDWNRGKITSFEGNIENPALYHYVYLPFYVIGSVPFYLFLQMVFNFYDQRLIILLAIFSLLFLTFRLIKNKKNYLWFFALFFLNPWVMEYWIWGVNDAVILVFILLSLWFLMRKKYSWATLIFVLGCLIKQSVWFLLPFYFIYIYFQEKNNKKLLIKQFLIFFIVAAIVILPFIIWDHVSFFDDTVRYLSGKSTTSYPMAGYGFGQLLLLNNLVKSSDYFPFWIFQLVAGLPVLIFLIKKQKEMNNLSTIILSYVMFLFVVWYFSRYFTVTHLVFIIQLLLLGVFLKFEEKNKIKN